MVGIDFSKVKQARMRDYVLRFCIGGMISIAAAGISQGTNSRFGGIFVAFPAILLASLTLIGRCEGEERAEDDAKGGVVGAVALVVTTVVLSLTLQALAGAWSLLLALLTWLICGIGLYVVCFKLGWLRHTPRRSR